MLANVLRSPVAVRASIQVVRAFVNLRQMGSRLSNVGVGNTTPELQ